MTMPTLTRATMPHTSEELTAFVAAVAEAAVRLRGALARLADEPKAAGVRYAARKLQAALDAAGVELVDFTGQAYDEGLAIDVAEVGGQRSAVGGQTKYTILRMEMPMVTWNGHVVARGQAVLQAQAEPRASWQQRLSLHRRHARIRNRESRIANSFPQKGGPHVRN